jgi:exonuclease VII small subunit
MKKVNIQTTMIFIFSFFFVFQSVAQKDTTELDVGKKKLIIIDKKTKDENAVYNLEKGKQTFEEEIRKADELIRKHEEMLQEIEMKLQQAMEEEGHSLDFHFEGFDPEEIQKEIAEAFEEFGNDTNEFGSKHFDFYFKEVEPDEFDDAENEVKIIMKGFDVDDENIEIIISENGDIYMNDEKIFDHSELEAQIEKHKEIIEMNEKKKYAFESGIREIEKGIEELEAGLEGIDDDLEELEGLDEKIEKHINKKRFNTHWAGFEVGLFNFMNSNQAIASDNDADFLRLKPERSMSYSLNVLEFNIPISKYSFGIGTGAGLEWNSMSLAENINLVEDIEGVIQAEYITDPEIEMKKNKFNAAYVKVPVIFELQLPIGHRKIFVGAGVTGSMRAWSKQKQTYFIDGRKFKDKKSDDFQLSPFRYGLTARLGYGSFGVFVNYEMVSLFKENKGPELYPVMIGLHLIDF